MNDGETKTETKTVEIRAHMGNLLAEAARSCQSFGLTMGLQIVMNRTMKIAQFALKNAEAPGMQDIIHQLELLEVVSVTRTSDVEVTSVKAGG